MKSYTERINVRTAHSRSHRLLTAGACLVLGLSAGLLPAQTNWSVVGWNNLGMHCGDADFSVFCLLPPYNTIHAQVINGAGRLVGGDSGVTVSYQAVADPSGSINKTTYSKVNFWQYSQALFGVTPPPDVGLPVPGPEGYAMPGPNNVPQAMGYASSAQWFEAYGIPIMPFDDAGRTNTYPLMRLVAKSGGTTVSTADIVLPVSAEVNCLACHASGSSPAAQPADGWVYDPSSERDFRLNVLRLHDDRQLGTPAFGNALAAMQFDPAGLYATVVNGGRPILCAACHLSEALPGSGLVGIPPLTESIHSTHATAVDPANGMLLGASINRTSCYYCHPGRATKCLRGVMGQAVAPDGQLEMQCQHCHGGMLAVGAAGRTGWLDEPSCQACHSGDAMSNAGEIRYTSVFLANGSMRAPTNPRFATTPDVPASGYSLYRFSRGHGGLYCIACHNSTHAEFPSADVNDNIISKQRQGYVGPLAECQSCHHTEPNTVTGGPHGLHPLGQSWVSRHPDASGGSAQCRICHGADYRGTVLSRSRADRTLGAFGTKTFWRGFQIGCYTCHNGPQSEDRNPNAAAVVQNRAATTSAGTPVAIPLQATDANNNPLTLRVVSQAAHGTVGLSGTVATYFPDAGYSGSDSFTFAAWDGSTDSNLGSVTLTVTGGPGGGCTYSIAPASAAVAAGAGTGTIAVNTGAGCAWSASSSAPWITIVSGASGNGPGQVSYSYTANAGSAGRSGSLSVAGRPFSLTQGGVDCSYTISPTNAVYGTGGGRGSVEVHTSPGCAWQASSAAAWVTIASGAGGTGPATVTFDVAPHSGTAARATTLTIAGRPFGVTQAGSACTYTIQPPSAAFGAGAGSGVVTVTTAGGCAWTVNNNLAWVTITSGSSGAGPGTVAFNVAANSGAARSGTLTIAGRSFAVTQAAGTAGGCTYVISPTSARISAGGGSGSVRVGTASGCPWTVRSNAGWITITTRSSGSGPDTVKYQVARNTNRRSRTGTVTVAGRTFTVYQSGARAEYGSSQGGAFGEVVLSGKPARERLTAEIVLENGGEAAMTAVRPAVYLSDDEELDAADTLLWTRGVPGLEPGENRVNKFRISLPGRTTAQGKYLVVVVNPIGVLAARSDETLAYGPLD